MAGSFFVSCTDEADSPLATYEPTQPGAGDMSLLQGEFHLEDGCAYVKAQRHPDDPELSYYLPLFPDEEVQLLDGDALEYNDTRYQNGDPIDLGGGGPRHTLDEAIADDALPENSSISEDCRGDARMFTVASEARYGSS
ncbi:hypothetical protein [Nesterenkonia populi]|uniref:hypothetical protein n=1 Tax=Nesterenkonia populi TaxID=1591087 RepID=UPI0011BE593D|nr:hypothetical protein [Nesterenkonia populi]